MAEVSTGPVGLEVCPLVLKIIMWLQEKGSQNLECTGLILEVTTGLLCQMFLFFFT